MAKIYISSTYSDLKAEREAVAQAVRRLGHQPIAMEDYTASSEKPLEKCLADVRECRLFVGIYAWRYGYIPNGRKRSITHLEYDQATEIGLPCFLFLLHEDAAWPPARVDDDRSLIKAFRNSVAEMKLVAYFKNGDELSAHVSASLSRQADPSVPDRSETLPYLCNRSDQEQILRSELDPAEGKRSRRPFVCVIHGQQQECHWEFVKRMRNVLLPQFLKIEESKVSIKEYLPRWDSSSQAVEKRLEKLVTNLAFELVNRSVRVEDMIEAVVLLEQPVMMNYHLSASSNWEQEFELIKKWIVFWGRWPDLPVGCDLFISLSIAYKNRHELSLLEKLRYGKSAENLRNAIGSLNFQEHNLKGVVLPELASVPRDEVEHWAIKHGAQFCNTQKVLLDIPKIYERLKRDTLPMDQLLDELKILTSKYCR
jgi:hypothetical protein